MELEPKIRLVLFDASGTLIDDSHATWLTFCKTFKKYGLRQLSYEEFKEQFCLPCWRFLVKNGMSIDQALYEFPNVFNQFYLDSLNHIEVFSDVEKSLSELERRAIKMGIVSATPKELLMSALQNLGLVYYFDAIIGDAKKPSPQPIVEASREIGSYRRKDIMYVGDMEEDIVAANRAGVVSVGIHRSGSYHSRRKLEKRRPNHIISNLKQLERLIN